MPANSFKLDVLQLTHKEFNQRYGSPLSQKDFLMLRAAMTESTRGKLLFAAVETDPGVPVVLDPPWPTNGIVTKLYLKIIGTGIITVVGGNPAAVSLRLDSQGTTGPNEVTIDEMEMIFGATTGIGSLVFTAISDTPSLLWMAWGYTPATS